MQHSQSDSIAPQQFKAAAFVTREGRTRRARRGDDMAKIFAVTIIIIAIASAIPIVMHMWPMPQDISTHGHLIDEQYADTMLEAGISFLASQFLLAFFIWKFSSPKPGDKIRSFPGGAAGLVIAAFLLVGTECLALGVFGVKAWASVYFTPPVSECGAGSSAGGTICFLFPLPRPGRNVRAFARGPDQ